MTAHPKPVVHGTWYGALYSSGLMQGIVPRVVPSPCVWRGLVPSGVPAVVRSAAHCWSTRGGCAARTARRCS